MQTNEYVIARKSQLKFYRAVELFSHVEGKGFVLYKRSGITLGDIRLDHGMHPRALYIRQADRLKGLQEAQKGFNQQLEGYVSAGDSAKVKETVVTIVEETLAEPRSGSLEGVSDTVDILVSDCVKDSEVVRSLVDMSYTDYSTVLHSINVMALALSFAFHMDYSTDQAKLLGLCALLHDVGKTRIRPEILTAPRRLTEEEFEVVKRHTTIGYNILSQCKFRDKDVSLAALEHHERLDGSGYPSGKTNISQVSGIIGIIDCYEALTNYERPYRCAMRAFDTLHGIIGNEVKSGKFSRDIYCQFVTSLGQMSKERNLRTIYPLDEETPQIAGMR